MLSLILAAAAAAAPAPASLTSEAATHIAHLTTGPCYDIARSAIAMPAASDIPGRDAMVIAFGLEPGLPPKLLDRLGPGGSALVSRATMGSKSIGEDALVLAFGGEIPGCSVALVTGSATSREYEIVAALVAAGWKELNSGVAQQRGFVGKRMVVKRDEAGKPYLVNILTIMQPGSEFRHVTTVVAIPPHVTLQAGF